MNNSVFSGFLNSARDAEERTASGKLFQAEVAAAEKAVALMVARLVREMTRVDIRDLHQRELQLLRCPSVRCTSVCLSQHGPTAANPLLQVCCCGAAGRRYQSIAARSGLSSSSVRRANAGSATSSAYVGNLFSHAVTYPTVLSVTNIHCVSIPLYYFLTK